MIKPLGSKVLVRPNPVEEKVGSFYVPLDEDDKRPVSGEVIAVGPGRWVGDKLIPMEVKEGDRVSWTTYAGNTVDLDGEKAVVLEEKEILFIY